MKFKSHDIIFFTTSETSPVVENICEIEEFYPETNEIKTNNVITIIKNPNSFKVVNDMGIISTYNRIKDDKESMFINLNNFDVYGIVKDSQIIETLHNSKTKLILDKSLEKLNEEEKITKALLGNK